MSHKPFPLAGYTEGLYLATESFLAPNNAYRELINGRIFRGRLEKRAGYSYFGAMGAPPVTDLPSSTNVFSPYPSNNPFLFKTDQIPIQNTNGEYTTIVAETVLFELGSLQGVLRDRKIELETNSPIIDPISKVEVGFYVNSNFSAFFMRWEDHPDYAGEDVNDATMTYVPKPGNPITGISELKTDLATHLFAFDTKSIGLWNEADRYFEPQDGPGDIDAGDLTINFSGEADDLVWTWPASSLIQSYLIITNGIDPVYRWIEGASPPVEAMPVDLDPTGNLPGGDPDTINTALLVVIFRGRLIYFGPTESGTKRSRRARFTIAGSFTVFADDGLGWVDAPLTFGDIRTAGFIGDRLYVGFENGWMELRRTGSPIAPFEWLPVTSRFGASAKLTTIPDSNRLLTRSSSSMQAIDPNGQYEIDVSIPDYVTRWEPGKGALSVAARNEHAREFWWSFVDSAGEEINAALVAQYDSKGVLSWSQYDTDFRAFGHFEQQETVNWDDLIGNWDDYGNVRWDDQDASSGFPIFLGGKLDGVVYRIGTVSSDDTLPVAFVARTQALSPFPGMRAHMGWVDFYAEASPGTVVEITFYDNPGGPGYKTVEVDFSPAEGEGQKVYRRVRVGRIAQFHLIKVSSTSRDFFAIDAIIPWFRPAGITQEFG